MGGLVIKRAYILAKQKEEFNVLADRVRTILFLATPHRGADIAQLLSKILNLSTGARPFVADLHRNSIATQSINDEFPQYCQNLQLYSFYETLPISYGVGKTLVVDKDLATLGYANERTAYLNANHREVCKYSAKTDSNYQTVRNALASTIDSFRTRATDSRRTIDNEQKRLLDGYLGVLDAPEDDFVGIDTTRMKGSCEWLVEKRSFLEWRDSANTQLYWISAKPATGKTVLSGRIIHHIKDLNRDLTFYFFDYRNKAKTTISSFLLSVAWQMSRMHIEVLDVVLEICGKDDQLCNADYRSIWRKLFVEGILRTKLVRPQYWVIDALDECKSSSELVPLLLKIIEGSPIRIIVTTRRRFELHSRVTSLGVKVVSEEIQENDTISDIMIYLEAHMDQLPLIDEEARQNMVAKIISKSNGCFLWVSLILQELKQVHTSAEIRQVLEDVPSDMNQLYSRILSVMGAATYGKKLAKAILTWTVCSARPLTTQELYHALQIDLKDNIDSVERSIESSCGQLVYIDAQSRVQMIHQTARDYLLQAGETVEFAIDSKLGHKTIAMTCLHYLNGNEMKGPKHRRLSASHIVKQRCPFITYACQSFYEHITHISSIDDEILSELARFLRSSNVLAWIEYIAQNSDLIRLIQAGKVFKNFLQRRSYYLSPIGKEVALIDSWSIDLVRLVTKFGKNLLAFPSSIFQLIPPFCPPETAPWKQFAASTRGIAVLGLSNTNWDDCLSTVVNVNELFSALACSKEYFAIGMLSGKIAIYYEMTCQEAQTLLHHESVRILEFSKTLDVLASAGVKKIRIWNTRSWEQIWEFDIAQMPMSVTFMEEQQLLLGALKNNQLMIWDLVTGTPRESANWTTDLEGPNAHAYRRPIAAAFCMESGLLAVIYRGQDILLWDLERDSLHDIYCKETGARVHGRERISTPGVTGLVFSLAPNTSLLAASYADGDLVLFDTSEGTVRAVTLANAQTLASSPDGRTLASGNSSGVIQLFDFETLKLLYRINSEEYGIQDLVFSENSHRLLDIRGSQCRVWDPTVLVRQDIDEENSDTVSVSTIAQEVSLARSENAILITSLACYKSENIYFCGKEDGSVYLYETKSAQQISKVFSCAHGITILSLFLEEQSQVLSSVDSSSRVMAHKLTRRQKGWEAAEVLFDHRAGVAVHQVLSNSTSTRLLVCTAEKDILWSIGTSGNTVIRELFWQDRVAYRWAQHPAQQDQLILIMKNVAHLYDWQTLQRLTRNEGILLEGSILPELAIQFIMHCSGGTLLSTTFRESLQPHSESRLLLWNTSDFCVDSASAAPVPKYRSLASQVKNLIGEHEQRLVFLHGSGWICSANLQSSNINEYTRHFFLPADWLSTNDDLMFGLTRNGDITFVKRDQVAVIKRGLDTVEPSVNGPGKRPSLLTGNRPSLTVPEPDGV
ncbi:hypothetical protein MMC11_005082 [Xylographa trunciseda]|nr:hypothetical protein [Xylographa trunciseda]